MPEPRYPAFVFSLGDMPTRYFCFEDGSKSAFSTKSGGADVLIDAYVAGMITAQQMRWGMKVIDESDLPESLPESDDELGFKNLPPGQFIQ